MGARDVLLHECLLPLLVEYQDGLCYDFLPYVRPYLAAQRRWRGLVAQHGRRAHEAMASQCTCEHTPSSLCLSTLSGPTVCMANELAYHVHLAIRANNVQALDGWLRYAPAEATPRAITCAARYGAINCLQRLVALVSSDALPMRALEYAVELGHESIFAALYPRFPATRLLHDGDTNLLDLAASVGHFRIVVLLHTADYPRGATVLAMDAASSNGHEEVVRYLHQHRTEGASVAALDGAAAAGHLAIVAFLHMTQRTATARALEMAAANGHLAVVEYLCTHRREGCRTYAIDDAAKNGHLEVVRLLHTRGFACTFRAMNNAALNGHLAILAFLHDNRNEGCTVFAMDWAASKGYLDVVCFLQERRREGCTTRAMNGAAKAGHLAVVRYLHHHRNEGCTTDAIDCAAANGHADVVEFLVSHRSEGFTPRALHAAAEKADTVLFELLRSAYPGLRRGARAAFCQAEAALVA
ncbi:hypothetical protein SPRG_05783 [Saprolegnia parasitica CBS 223.65]|uniref:Uncharacterized protein n=1 Tax=Saprolegnia parasitica (strain CBS 223.65) TaxID=695850 RepID=A0A067CQ19_SAPPC|nr:hypothetical protein SPRG_05783 [Saprolegnia parasitica CBS 223.65]KDO28912.1 hypothetical protein SPRG_05783 [Saprolegnia parasitica CBS 223.65]|eukprot:XP_012200455.1 hypothetical protein SPRG_05783 [Saprolegnia parasitica CBS 223.65]